MEDITILESEGTSVATVVGVVAKENSRSKYEGSEMDDGVAGMRARQSSAGSKCGTEHWLAGPGKDSGVTGRALAASIRFNDNPL